MTHHCHLLDTHEMCLLPLSQPKTYNLLTLSIQTLTNEIYPSRFRTIYSSVYSLLVRRPQILLKKSGARSFQTLSVMYVFGVTMTFDPGRALCFVAKKKP